MQVHTSQVSPTLSRQKRPTYPLSLCTDDRVVFDAASYTRAILGPPASWSEEWLFSALTSTEQATGRLSGRSDSAITSYLDEWKTLGRDQENLCRDYACCGLGLKDLHALTEHFEDMHVEATELPVEYLDPQIPEAMVQPECLNPAVVQPLYNRSLFTTPAPDLAPQPPINAQAHAL
ncbi:unnamed protein product [Peniophora sp. CBMAI 1063]|nr:unnamed protein product [Peniophora sp. CBMAI 1063]